MALFDRDDTLLVGDDFTDRSIHVDLLELAFLMKAAQSTAVHALFDVVDNDFVGVLDELVLALLVGAHREQNLAGPDPLVLDILVLGLGDADNDVCIFADLFRRLRDDDVAVLHKVRAVGLVLLRRSGEHVVHDDLVQRKALGERHGLGVPLHAGAVKPQRNIALLREIARSDGRLGAGAQVRDVSAVHDADKLERRSVDQHKQGRDIGQVHERTHAEVAASPLQARNVLEADERGHGVHEALVRRVFGSFAKVKVHLGGVNNGTFAHAVVCLLDDVHDVFHRDEALDHILAQQTGFHVKRSSLWENLRDSRF